MTNFIVVGNHSAITYKEVFPYLKDNKMWLGYKPLGGEMYFHITDEYKEEIVKTKKEGTGWVEVNGEIMANVSQACWFTNLEHSKRKEFIGLTKKYNPTDYPKYDNYDAISVKFVNDIPKDYYGLMGVPITFLDRYCPSQFEIVGASEQCGRGFAKGIFDESSTIKHPLINGNKIYSRLFIRKRTEKENNETDIK